MEALWELVSDYQEMYRYEYKGIEHNINFTAEMTDMPATLIPEEIQDDLINAIEGCQNGVISMSWSIFRVRSNRLQTWQSSSPRTK